MRLAEAAREDHPTRWYRDGDRAGGCPCDPHCLRSGQGEAARQALARFEDGRRAYEKKRFEEVVSLMSAAIKLDDREKISGFMGRGTTIFPISIWDKPSANWAVAVPR